MAGQTKWMAEKCFGQTVKVKKKAKSFYYFDNFVPFGGKQCNK